MKERCECLREMRDDLYNFFCFLSARLHQTSRAVGSGEGGGAPGEVRHGLLLGSPRNTLGVSYAFVSVLSSPDVQLWVVRVYGGTHSSVRIAALGAG